MKNYQLFILLTTFLWSCNHDSKETVWLAEAPAGDNYAIVNPTGQSIIPNGRIIEPYGKTVRTAPHPYGLILSPNGEIAITANSGTRPFSISIIDQLYSDQPRVRQIPEGPLNDEGLLEAVFMGLAITPDNKYVYVAGGKANKIFKFDIESATKVDSIDCAIMVGEHDFTDGYIGDMVLSTDGKTLYAVDQIGFRMMIIDTETNEITANIPTGRYPFGICLSPDGSKAFVANVGMFEYSFLGQIDPNDPKGTGLDYPPSGFGSKEMTEGYANDSVQVPGLGDPNVPESFSVWEVDLEKKEVTSKIKTGFLVGELVEGIPAVGGSSPNSLVATDQYVFVSNGNNDCISVIDYQKDTVIQNVFLSPEDRLRPYRGMIPFGIDISPDQKRLYVAEAGINSVGVIDIESMETVGHIPVGWFPSKLQVSPDGKKLIVANAKGYGSGPNGGADYEVGPEGTYIGALMKGSVTIMDIPTDEELTKLTQQTITNNFAIVPSTDARFAGRKNNPVPLYGGEKESPIKYIVFISKENRTYDEVFGQVKDGKGDATLARYGANRTFSKRNGSDTVTDVTVMKNHLALAQQYAISDNFYVDSDHSADGHRWLVNTYPNEWVETHVAASYGGKRRFKPFSKAPGKFGFVGSTGAIYPEGYNEAGSMWDHLERHNVEFFNFGFGMELAAAYADSTLKYTGVKYLSNFPVPGPLYDRSSRKYPTYNMAIPDQFRAKMFIEEITDRYLEPGKELPSLLTVLLPNDHGAGERPKAGYPYKESYMMDNDLALARIIEFLSHTPYWKNMAIVVTMDDAQDGQDHIDAHRSVLMVISPYAKKNYVGHRHYSFGSIFKTFWNILGIPPLNQYDAAATDLSDLFQAEADTSRYQAFPMDTRVFDPQKVLNPFDENFDWKAVVESPELDNVEDFQESHKNNQ